MESSYIKGYRLNKLLGSGAFGEIYSANNTRTGEEVAMKMEKKKTDTPQLAYEAKLYAFIQRDSTYLTNGIPNFHTYFSDGDYNVMVIEKLGPSLDTLFTDAKHKFSVKTLCMLAIEMICRLEFLHSKGLVHRDMKPDNFVIGLNSKRNEIYVIDFGLSKSFMGKDGVHIPFKRNKSLIGTARYASVNNHLGLELSRRDDLESLSYILVYFAKGGQLPWMSLPAPTMREKYKKILDKKRSISTAELTKDLPIEIGQLLDYTKSLAFEETPNYSWCKRLFHHILIKNFDPFDSRFDWIVSGDKDTETYDSLQVFKAEKEDVSPFNELLVKEKKRQNIVFDQKIDSKFGLRPSNVIDRRESSNLGIGSHNTLFKSMAGQVLKQANRFSYR